MSKLYYCSMIQNRRWEVVDCVNRVLPYVDKIILVDGGSIDDSIIYFRNLEKEEPKLEFHLHPWRDNFPMQRNKYLQYVPENNWAIVSDPDELFVEDTCKEWRRLADEAEASNLEWNGYAFRAHDISMRGEKIVWESKPEDSRKPLMFYKFSDTHYLEERNPHEQLVCGQGYRYKNTDLFYQHRKQADVIWVRGCRNFFIGGGGPNLGANNPLWMPFRELVKRKINITKWDNFNEYLIRGKIDKDIKQKFIEFRLITGFDGSSELRECYKYYFRILHPEEEPEELRGEQIQ